MFPSLHPAAMVSPMGMGLAFNPGVPMQPHLRVPGPGSFLSGYYPAAFNGVQVPGSTAGTKPSSATIPVSSATASGSTQGK